jgi:hypothetical protein
MDGRVISAFTRVFDALCPAMTIFFDYKITTLLTTYCVKTISFASPRLTGIWPKRAEMGCLTL